MFRFKHDTMTAEEFYNANAVNYAKLVIPAMFKDENIPELLRDSDKRFYSSKAVAPKKFIITCIYKTSFGDGTYYYTIYCLDLKNSNTMSIYVKASHPICVLTGTTKMKMLKEHEKRELKDFHNKLGHGFTIGADPEIFVEDSKGVIIPAYTFLGSKAEPNKFHSHKYDKEQTVYWDGFQAEFTTPPAETCLGWFGDYIQAGLKEILTLARKVDPNAKLSIKTVMNIPNEMLDKASNEHVSLGCMPSLNIYGLKGQAVEDPRQMMFRPAGGHIHIGYGKKDDATTARVVKALDGVLGVMCVALFANYDDPIRRQYYGLPGEHRLPPHGLEYRVLSNAWLFHPLIMHLVYDLARKIVILGEKDYFSKLWKTAEVDTISTITDCNVVAAKKIMDTNKEVIKKLIFAAYRCDEKSQDLVYNIFYNGMESVIEDPTNLYKNWGLNGGWVDHRYGNICFSRKQNELLAGKKVA